jgi:hypothetical protein
LVEAGNSVIVVEHDMNVVAHSDWMIDIGPGAGDEGGKVVAVGPPLEIARKKRGLTANYLHLALGQAAYNAALPQGLTRVFGKPLSSSPSISSAKDTRGISRREE